jgi:YVTN family beta-propeller protein
MEDTVPRHPRLHLLITILISTIACSLSGTREPTTEAPTPSPPAPAEPVELDLCTLLSEAEVSEALGDQLVLQPGLQTGTCSFASTGSAQPKYASVSAAQGEQARQLIQMAASLGVLFGGDPAMLQMAEDLKSNAASMTLEEVVEKGNSLLAPLGYAYTASGTPEEPMIWGWNPLGMGSLQWVRDETYLAVSAGGPNEEESKTAAAILLTLARDRLPAAFTIELADSLRVEFTAAPPTVVPEPSLPSPSPVHSTIWVADRQAGRVARIDAASGNVVAEISVGSRPMSIAVEESAVWVANEGDGTVSRIDPATNQVVATIPIGQAGFLRVAAGEGRVWAAACLDNVVAVIDPVLDQVTDTVPVEGCWNVAVAAGAVWVPAGERSVVRINPETLLAVPAVIVQSGPAEIIAGFDSMWVANANARTVSRFDPQTRQVTATLRTGLDHATDGVRGLAAGEGRVWLATTDGVLAFDPETNALVAAFHAVDDAWFLATAGGFVWVTTNSADGLVALDPSTGDVVRRVIWGTVPLAIASGP